MFNGSMQAEFVETTNSGIDEVPVIFVKAFKEY